MEPLVSIIVPLYNYENYIQDCIRSIIYQDYPNYELIIADDLSTDNSYKIASAFQNDRIKVIRLPANKGYSTAKNEAIIASQGELITCLDADDMLTKNSISCRVEAFKNKDVCFVHARAFNVRGSISLNDCYKKKLHHIKKPRIHAQTVMVKRDVYMKYGLYDEKLRSKSDKEMWWRLFGKNDSAKFKIPKTFVDKFVAYYRIHNSSMMAKRRKKPKLQKKLLRQLEGSFVMRQSGITKENTRFLEK
jgi:glycosyltransferase involved in cell wall biosynthesis